MKIIFKFFRAIAGKILINRFTRDKSIRSKLILYFLIFTVLPLTIMGIAAYYRTKLTIEHKTSQYLRQLLEQVDINLNYYLRDAIYISSLLSTNQNLGYLLRDYDQGDEVGKMKSEAEITRILSDLINTKVGMFSIVFYKKNEKIFSSYAFVGMDKIVQEEYFKDVESGKKDLFIIGKNKLLQIPHTGSRHV